MSALCCGSREKLPELRAEQKWDYINLDEFKSTSCLTPLSYGILYISLIISVAVYAVDTFTAVNLIAFDRWSGQVKPAIPFSISRWIFTGCIILSFVLLFYRWLRAVRVMKQGGVAQSYLDPLAVRVQSVRMGSNGRGWKRFLVFAELTKGKKGADYVALFTYYSFEAWLRICFAEGPRQVINAITLYSVMQLKLIPTGEHAATDGRSSVAQFFVNIEALADSDKQQAVILFGMLFTLVIWVISIINLAIAVLLYIFFLFHHIPSVDGGLQSYCRRKINSSMEKIVQKKVAKALKKENAIRARQEAKGKGDAKRQPTLPSIGVEKDEKAPDMPLLSRTTTQATLPSYHSDAGSVSNLSLSRQPSMPDIPGRPGPPPRILTQATNASYGVNAPLVGNAGAMGYGGRPASPVISPMASVISPMAYSMRSESPRPASPANYAPGNRTMTMSSQTSQRSYPGSGPGPGPRPPTAQGRQPPGMHPSGPARTGTMTSMSSTGYQQPPFPTNTYQMGPMPRPGTANSMGPQSMGRQTPGSSPIDARGQPAFSNHPYTNSRSPPPQQGSPNGSYMPFNALGPQGPPQSGPQGIYPRNVPPRSMTQPNASSSYAGGSGRPPPRSGTAPPPPNGQGGYDDILNAY